MQGLTYPGGRYRFLGRGVSNQGGNFVAPTVLYGWWFI